MTQIDWAALEEEWAQEMQEESEREATRIGSGNEKFFPEDELAFVVRT